ncbi:MAG: hypothetical protein IPL61_00565 [Myxococcales bacterium]|nr:hypothetical protein [Myxococcales bacterium]
MAHLPRRLAIAALLVAGCGKGAAPKPAAADCQAACAHMLDLAMQDLDRSAAQPGAEAMAAMMAELKAKAQASRASDLATCQATCMEGKLDTACARATTTIDGVSACTNRNGGLR